MVLSTSFLKSFSDNLIDQIHRYIFYLPQYHMSPIKNFLSIFPNFTNNLLETIADSTLADSEPTSCIWGVPFSIIILLKTNFVPVCQLRQKKKQPQNSVASSNNSLCQLYLNRIGKNYFSSLSFCRLIWLSWTALLHSFWSKAIWISKVI